MLQSILNGFMLGLIASPSCPSNAEEIRQGTRNGFWPAVTVAVGAVTGDALILVLLLLGIAPLLERVQAPSATLFLLGALILAYVAWGIFKEAASVEGTAQFDYNRSPAPTGAMLRAFWVGFAITTFNPFTVVWWLGLLGPALASEGNLPVSFALAVLAGSFAWFAVLALLLQVGRRWLTQRVLHWVLLLSGTGAGAYAIYFLWQALKEVV
jgi:L-lysine exporter family protein LysE/ArgO